MPPGDSWQSQRRKLLPLTRLLFYFFSDLPRLPTFSLDRRGGLQSQLCLSSPQRRQPAKAPPETNGQIGLSTERMDRWASHTGRLAEGQADARRAPLKWWNCRDQSQVRLLRPWHIYHCLIPYPSSAYTLLCLCTFAILFSDKSQGKHFQIWRSMSLPTCHSEITCSTITQGGHCPVHAISTVTQQQGGSKYMPLGKAKVNWYCCSL